MFSTLTLVAVMLAAPVPKEATPPGPVPRLLEIKADADGKVRVQVLRQVKNTVTVNTVVNKNGQNVVEAQQREVSSWSISRAELSEVKELSIWTVDGKEADKPLAMKKLAEGAVVVVSADGKKVDPKYLKLFRDDVLVLASPELLERPTASTTVRPVNGAVQVLPAMPLQIAPAVAPPPPPAPGAAVPTASTRKAIEKKADVKKEEKKAEEKKKD
jgi:hypothetical protein